MYKLSVGRALEEDPQGMAQLRLFLLQHGIAVTVSESSGKLEMWLLDPHSQEQAKLLIEDFKRTGTNSPLETSQGSVLGPTLSSLAQQAGIFTFVIFVVTLMVAALQVLWSMESVFGALMITPLDSNELQWSQPWRLFTPALIHLSATHLFFNLFWWWYLGGRLELRFGAAHLALVTVVTAVAANLAQWYSSGPLFGGLSGVVYGLLGFCAVYGWQRRTTLTLPNALLVFMVGWLVLGYTDLLWPNMANEAHLFGLLSGLALGAMYRRWAH